MKSSKKRTTAPTKIKCESFLAKKKLTTIVDYTGLKPVTLCNIDA